MEVLPVAARLLQFLGAAVLFGAPLFFLYGLAGREGRDAIRRAWPPLAFVVAAVALLAGGALSLALETADMSGQPGDAYRLGAIAEVLADTRFGHGMVVRLALSSLALLTSALPVSRGQWSLFVLLGGGVLASFSWTGHGGSDEGLAGGLHLTADIVHLLAAGVWLGALAVLAVLLARDRAGVHPSPTTALHRGLQGFSGVGSGVVGLLLLSGLVNGWFLVGPQHVGDLVRTPYGVLLLVKLGLFVAMLGLAAHNQFTLTPRLGQFLGAPSGASSGEALAGLRRSVLIETALGVAVLAVVAALGLLPPASMG